MPKQPWTDRNHAVALLWEEPEKKDGYIHLNIRLVRVEDGQIRNHSWREPFDDLYIRAYLSDQHPEDQPQALLEFRPFSVDLSRARSMVKVLDSADRFLRREYERHGNAADYAARVSRLADALKATAFVRCTKTHGGWSYDDSEHAITPMGEGIDWLRRAVAALQAPATADTAAA